MITFSIAVKNARAQALASAIDTGSAGPATLTLYTGTRPASGAAITDQVAVVVLEFANPSAASVSGGVLNLNPLAEQMADASGTITWGRILDRDGAFVADISVGIPDSGEDLELPAVQIFQGALIRIDTGTLSEP